MRGNFVGPAVGMGGFAVALALPFSPVRHLPVMAQGNAPLGGWLNSVKVVL